MKTGDLVKFKEAMEPGEERLVMRVIEMRGDRVLVECLVEGLHILPTSVYPVADLVVIRYA